jgi:hypothetical protein
MDSSDPNAKTPEQFQGGVPTWRTTLVECASSAEGGEAAQHGDGVDQR